MLNPYDNNLEQYFDLLSESEKFNINKIKIDEVRTRSISSKFITKFILSGYIGVDIQNITFSYNEFGKPEILHSLNPLNLQFNVSHSGDLGIMVVTIGNSVGIDIEKITDLENMDEIINLCFSDQEINFMTGLDKPFKTEIFYKIWTGKEAFVKALGTGLSFPLKNISFRLNDNRTLIIDEIFLQRDPYNNWQVYNFNPGDKYTSTLVVNNNLFTTKHFVWSPEENVTEISY